MGSPYTITCVGRVNVVRTAKGFERLSREICSIASSEFLRPVTDLVAEIIECPTDQRWSGMVFDDDVDRGYQKLQNYLMTGVSDWTAFVPEYLHLCEFAICCKADRARQVVILQTKYSFEESERLNRAVVFNFTMEGN